MKKGIDVVLWKLFFLMELIFVTVLLIPVGLSVNCHGQSDPGTAPESAEDAPSEQVNSVEDVPPEQVNSIENAPQQEQLVTQADENFAPQVLDGETDTEEPATDLGTGLPLSTLLTPLHWGNLSLLSFTAYEGYNSNPQYARIPVSSYITSMNGLVIFSPRFGGWQMDAQYMPFVWISSRATLKSFSAMSLDLRTLRRINGNWRWTFVDKFRYAPTHSTEQQPGIVADSNGGFSVGNAFLSSGRNVLVNGAATTLTDHYSESSSLAFHANGLVRRLSSYITAQSSDNLPAQDAIAFSSGVVWHHRYGSSSSVNLDYNYRLQTSTATTAADVQTQSAGAGWSHRFGHRFSLSGSFGPAWSIYNRNQAVSRPSSGGMTLHGSLALSKQFRQGAAILAFGRSNRFSGVISDSFQNRYDFTVLRQISTHLRCSGSASYVQQQFSNTRNTNGELVSGEARYFLTRNWSFFGQARYLKIHGSQRILMPETNIIVGFRWAWSPENP